MHINNDSECFSNITALTIQSQRLKERNKQIQYIEDSYNRRRVLLWSFTVPQAETRLPTQ
jgi:hypothetical protein